MPKYLLIGSYTAQGAKGVMAEGGSARRDVARRAVESVGGSLESFYYGFGGDDFYVIYDAPSHAAAAALSLTTASSGAITGRTVVLIMPEELDAAAGQHPDYRPPSG